MSFFPVTFIKHVVYIIFIMCFQTLVMGEHTATLLAVHSHAFNATHHLLMLNSNNNKACAYFPSD